MHIVHIFETCVGCILCLLFYLLFILENKHILYILHILLFKMKSFRLNCAWDPQSRKEAVAGQGDSAERAPHKLEISCRPVQGQPLEPLLQGGLALSVLCRVVVTVAAAVTTVAFPLKSPTSARGGTVRAAARPGGLWQCCWGYMWHGPPHVLGCPYVGRLRVCYMEPTLQTGSVQ